MQWRRFGKTPLYLDPFPGQLGGVVRGYIQINQLLTADSDVKVSVVALRRKRSNKSTSETPLWQRSRTGSVDVSAKGCRVRFDVPIENNLPTSGFNASKYTSGRSGVRVRHHWQLRLEHAASGLDRVFAIPVYDVESDKLVESADIEPDVARTGDSSLAANDKWFGLPDVKQPAPASDLPAGVSQSDKTLKIHFPLSHGIGMYAFVLMFGLVFFGAGLLVGIKEGGWFGWMFGSIFLLIGGLLSLASLVEVLTTKTVLFNSQSVETSTRLLGVVVSRREVNYSEIRTFKTKRSGSSSSGNHKHRIYYKVYGELEDAKVVNVAWMVEGDEAANGLSSYLNDLIDVA
ncbi:MAG: hypothetical protein AB8B87_02565 [Granulosicoccus sp.]